MRIVIVTITVLVLVTATYAAGPGFISGVVVDSASSVPLTGVLIAIKGSDKYTTSDDSGYFLIADVPSGRYVLSVTRIGYKKRNVTDVVVKPGRRTTANVELVSSLIEGELRIQAEHADYFTTKSDIVVSDHSMSHEEIRRQPGGMGDIQRVISSLPGVHNLGMMTDLYVRGGGPDENLVLLDDMEILSAAHFSGESGTHGLISVLNLNVVDNVEFIAGGFPAEYGRKRSSIMQLDLKEGSRENFSGSGYLDMMGFGALAEGPIGSGGNAPGSYIITGRYSTLELLDLMLGLTEEGQDMPNYWDANAKVIYRLSPRHKISLTGFYAIDSMLRTPIPDDEESDFFIDWRSDMDAEGITYEWIHSDKGTLRTTLYHSGNYWNYKSKSSVSMPIGSSEFQDLSRIVGQDEYAIKSRLAYSINSHLTLMFGGDGRYCTNDYNIRMVAQYDHQGRPVDESVNVGRITSYLGAGYSEITIRPNEWFTLTVGGRADYNDFGEDTNLSHRCGLRIRLTDKLSFNAATGRYFQPPTTTELIESDIATPGNVLKAGYADHYIAGLSYLLTPDTKVGVECYYKLLKQIPVSVLHEGDYLYLNSADGSVEGGEVFLHKKLSGKIFSRATYTLTNSEMRDRLGDVYRPTDYDVRHIVNLIMGYEPRSDWLISGKFSYSSGAPYTPIVGRFRNPGTEAYYAIEGEKNSVRMPVHHKLDLRLDKRFRFGSWSITTYIDAQNIYNQKRISEYEWNSDYSERTADTSVGIIPMLGFEAAF